MVSLETSNKTRILIADDEDLFLQTTAEILRCEGYRCDAVTNAMDGMEALRARNYELLIADINMPGNANLDFIRQGRVCFPQLPIILITGYPEIETAIQGIDLDIDHYLLKPLEIDLLLRKVGETLSSCGQRESNLPPSPQAAPFPRRVLDVEGRILFISKEFALRLGYRPEELIHQSMIDHAEAPLPLKAAATEAEVEETEVLEKRFLRRNGETLDALVIRRRIPAQTGRSGLIEEYVVEMSDAECAELRPAHGRRLENFALVTGGIAHDLNNMLNVVDGYLILSEEFIDPTHRVQGFLEESRRAVRRAASLTRKLLDLSRPRKTDRTEPIDLCDLFRELESMVRVRAKTGCETAFTISETAPRVVGNPDGLFDAIFNLITNALDSLSSGGGVVHILAEEANLDRDFCSVHPGLLPGRHLSIEVIDTGCGIPIDILDKIQEPYFTTKPRGEGTGLGLSIVFRVVREMGGAVDIRSCPGLGAAVTILLPVNR